MAKYEHNYFMNYLPNNIVKAMILNLVCKHCITHKYIRTKFIIRILVRCAPRLSARNISKYTSIAMDCSNREPRNLPDSACSGARGPYTKFSIHMDTAVYTRRSGSKISASYVYTLPRYSSTVDSKSWGPKK